jgi:hypothetical protein
LRDKVTFVRLDDVLCPHGRCAAVIDGQLARFDGTHFTSAFSRRIVPLIIARAERDGVRLSR